MSIAHPYAPSAEWRIAVSRRFNVPRVEQVYRDLVLPVISREGIVLECRSAGEDVSSTGDFWTRRMRLILELADVHVLLDIDRSSNVDFEFDISKRLLFKSKQPVLGADLGWHPIAASILLRPVSILIDEKAKRDTFSPLRRRGTLRLAAGSDSPIIFQDRLQDQLNRAKLEKLKDISKCEGWYGALARMARRGHRFPDETAKEVLAKATELARGIIADRDMESLRPIVTARPKEFGPENGRKLGVSMNEYDEWLIKLKSGKADLPGDYRNSYRCVRDTVRSRLLRDGLFGTKLSEDELDTGLPRFLLSVGAFFVAAKARRERRGRGRT